MRFDFLTAAIKSEFNFDSLFTVVIESFLSTNFSPASQKTLTNFPKKYKNIFQKVLTISVKWVIYVRKESSSGRIIFFDKFVFRETEFIKNYVFDSKNTTSFFYIIISLLIYTRKMWYSFFNLGENKT